MCQLFDWMCCLKEGVTFFWSSISWLIYEGVSHMHESNIKHMILILYYIHIAYSALGLYMWILWMTMWQHGESVIHAGNPATDWSWICQLTRVFLCRVFMSSPCESVCSYSLPQSINMHIKWQGELQNYLWVLRVDRIFVRDVIEW